MANCKIFYKLVSRVDVKSIGGFKRKFDFIINLMKIDNIPNNNDSLEMKIRPCSI